MATVTASSISVKPRLAVIVNPAWALREPQATLSSDPFRPVGAEAEALLLALREPVPLLLQMHWRRALDAFCARRLQCLPRYF